MARGKNVAPSAVEDTNFLHVVEQQFDKAADCPLLPPVEPLSNQIRNVSFEHARF